MLEYNIGRTSKEEINEYFESSYVKAQNAIYNYSKDGGKVMLEYDVAFNKMRYEIYDALGGGYYRGTDLDSTSYLAKNKRNFKDVLKIECFIVEEVVKRNLLIEKLKKRIKFEQVI